MSRDIRTSSTSAPCNRSNAVSTGPCPIFRAINDTSISTTTFSADASPSAPNHCADSASSKIYSPAEATTKTSSSIASACSTPQKSEQPIQKSIRLHSFMDAMDKHMQQYEHQHRHYKQHQKQQLITIQKQHTDLITTLLQN